MLTVLLTSYNRPFFLRRAIQSLLDQTDPDWACLVLDDNSSAETLSVLDEFEDNRIFVFKHSTADDERIERSRYAVLINEQLPELQEGLIAYLCDNVEYYPDFVRSAHDYFETNPERFAAYAYQRRDVWSADGMLRGTAAQFGHWDYLPPLDVKTLGGNIAGWVDHSQVIHRAPVDLRWSEDIATVKHGDADFYTCMIAEYGPIDPIATGPLTWEHIIK